MILILESFSPSALAGVDLLLKFLFFFISVSLMLLQRTMYTKSGISIGAAEDILKVHDTNASLDISTKTSDTMKYILLWNPYFQDPSYNLEEV